VTLTGSAFDDGQAIPLAPWVTARAELTARLPGGPASGAPDVHDTPGNPRTFLGGPRAAVVGPEPSLTSPGSVVTLSRMLPVRRGSSALLLALTVLAIAGPAAAHGPAPALSAAIIEAAPVPAIVPILSATAVAPPLPWYLPAALALVALTAWRRPRRAMVVTLAVLLCVFAFENALHSVHHGFDPKQQEECTVAAASAHLAAVQVDDPGLSSVMLPVVGRAEATSPASTPTRFLSPDQGRAPPSAIL
jgi:hypothetical protein